MSFLEIEEELRRQLCRVINHGCNKHLEKLIGDIMYFIKQGERRIVMKHTRFGSMQVQDQQYATIELLVKYGAITVTLWTDKGEKKTIYIK